MCGGATTQGPATTDDDTTNDACLAVIANVPASCIPTSQNDVDTLCSGECRGFYEDIAANCEFNVSFLSKITGFIIYQVILQVTTLCICNKYNYVIHHNCLGNDNM